MHSRVTADRKDLARVPLTDQLADTGCICSGVAYELQEGLC